MRSWKLLWIIIFLARLFLLLWKAWAKQNTYQIYHQLLHIQSTWMKKMMNIIFLGSWIWKVMAMVAYVARRAGPAFLQGEAAAWGL